MSNTWNVRFVTEWDEIYSQEFQNQWIRWVDNAPNTHVFFHPALCMAWLETYRPLRNLEPLFCLAKKKSAVVFLPLILWRQNWKNAFRKVIIPVGYSDFDYHDPIANCSLNPEEWASFYEGLLHELKSAANYDSMDLNGVITVGGYACADEENDVAPFTDLSVFHEPEDFRQSLKASLRGDIRRQIKRIRELGLIELYNYDKTDEALDALPQFLRLHSNRWPKSYKAPQFHKNIIISTLNKGLLHFSSLKVGDKILSYHLGFNFNQRYYYYMPVIDPEFENLSPGKIHLFNLIEYACNSGFTVFDHLRGDENYKTGWTSNAQKLYRISIQNEQMLSRIKNGLCDLKAKLA